MLYFLKVLEAFDKESLAYAIVGGWAVALHGYARGTIDLDIIVTIEEESLLNCEKLLRQLGYESRLPVSAKEVFHFREEYIKNRNLVAWSFYNKQKPFEVIDIILTHDLKKRKTVSKSFHGEKIKVLNIQDLIKMKRDSGRPQDLEDIKALEEQLK